MAASELFASQAWTAYFVPPSQDWLKSAVSVVRNMTTISEGVMGVASFEVCSSAHAKIIALLEDRNTTIPGLVGALAGTLSALAIHVLAYIRSLCRFGVLRLTIQIPLDATLIGGKPIALPATLGQSWHVWILSWNDEPVRQEQAIFEQTGNGIAVREGTIKSEEQQGPCSSCDSVVSMLGDLTDKARFQLGFAADITEERYYRCPLCRLIYLTIRYSSNYTSGVMNSVEPLVLQWHEKLRQFRLRQYDPPPSKRFREFGSFICIVKEQDSIWSAFAGARALIEEQIDPDRVRQWLDTCESSHPLCEPLSYEGMKRFPYRVIDVESSCVVNAPENCRYVCLSYVWGMAVSIQLTTQTLPRFSSPGGLSEILHELPNTIRDAIALLKLLKERYLWVDSLCLIQDDSIDMGNGIDNMASIYKRASLTVIAAAGTNANSGLPGLTTASRQITRDMEQICPGLKMTVVPDVEGRLEYTKWFKRAWTFQEMIASPRAVIFFDDRVNFSCMRCILSEDLEDDNAVIVPSYLYESPTRLMNLLNSAYIPPYTTNPVYNYTQLVMSYTSRELTDPTDIESALVSTLSRIDHKDQTFIACYSSALPLHGLAYFLLFKCFAPTVNQNQRRLGFPSWSWTGWFGETFWINRDIGKDLTEIEQWMGERTWISWFLRDARTEPNNICDQLEQESSLYSMTYAAPPTREESDWRFGPSFPFPQKYIPEKIKPIAGPKQAFSKLYNYHLRYPILQFWSATVWLTSSSIVSVGTGRYADLIDADQRRCGSIWLDSEDHFELKLPHLFVVLSQARHACHDDPWIMERHRYNQTMIEDPGLWDLFWVMLLDRHGDYYERRGIGHIFQRTVGRSLPPGPSWEEIMIA
ncbi:HET-domain-containing protein [Tothia fuscella]|uniref:HET-domain-containing protein n=1 Tax=Tothia fuscella TaxID=1048955 RepID=A0A9P4TTF8_9PEZI|nr:HET-domain-containing protein [Tothia fuscella]